MARRTKNQNGHRFREAYRESDAEQITMGTHTADQDKQNWNSSMTIVCWRSKNERQIKCRAFRQDCVPCVFTLSFCCPILLRSFNFSLYNFAVRFVGLNAARVCLALDIACCARLFFSRLLIRIYISHSTTLSEVAFKYVYTIIFWEVSYITTITLQLAVL